MGWWARLLEAFSNDRGFMVRDGHELRWGLPRLPLEVAIAGAAEHWRRDVEIVLEYFNDVTGRRLFLRADIALDGGLARAFANEPQRRLLRGLVLVDVTPEGDTFNRCPTSAGHCDLRHDKGSGELLNAIVRVSQIRPESTARRITMHEFGHVLGLDHDRHPNSVMWPVALERPPLLWRRDVRRLRDAYPVPPAPPKEPTA